MLMNDERWWMMNDDQWLWIPIEADERAANHRAIVVKPTSEQRITASSSKADKQPTVTNPIPSHIKSQPVVKEIQSRSNPISSSKFLSIDTIQDEQMWFNIFLHWWLWTPIEADERAANHRAIVEGRRAGRITAPSSKADEQPTLTNPILSHIKSHPISNPNP